MWFGLCSGQELGAESTLPYLSPELRGNKLLVGANFASAGIGILNDTGIQFVSSLLPTFISCFVENLNLTEYTQTFCR